MNRGSTRLPFGFALAVLALLPPLQAQVPERRRTLSRDYATCRWEAYPAPRTRLLVVNTFRLRNGSLTFDYSYQTVGYLPEQIVSPGGFRFERATLDRALPGEHAIASPEEKLYHRLVFRAPDGTRLGSVSLRYLWNGRLVHREAPRVRVDFPDYAHEAGRVALDSRLPLALLNGGRGQLDVHLLSGTQLLFGLTYRLNGFDRAGWHRDAARHPDVNASGVNLGGLLPARCGS